MYECNICKKCFANRQNRWRHQKNIHGCKSNDNVPEKKSSYECRFCENIYKHRQTRFTHEKMCKLSYEIKTNKKEFENHFLILENKNKQIEELLNQLIIAKSSNIIINNNHYDNSITNNLDITININPFGQEDLSHLTQEDKKSIIQSGHQCILKYIDKVHLNDSKPENHNLLITNIRSGLIQVFKKSGLWEHHDCNEILNTVIDKCYDFTNESYEELKETI